MGGAEHYRRLYVIMIMLVALTVVKVIDCRLAPASGPVPAAYTRSTSSDMVHIHKDYYHFGPFTTVLLVFSAIFAVIAIWAFLAKWALIFDVIFPPQEQQELEMMHM